MANKSGEALAPSGFRGLLDFGPFRDFEGRMRQFFGAGLAPFGRWGEENWSLTTWTPACDIYETDNEIVVKAELPEVKVQ